MKTDSRLKQNDINEFQWKPSIKEPEIGVKANKGIMSLTGNATSYFQKLAAERAVKRVGNTLKKSINIKKTPFTIIMLMFLLFSMTACEATKVESAENESKQSQRVHEPMTEKTEAENLRADMRKLWEDHVVWTRNVIFCLVDGLPGKDEALSRLMKNQDDIGNAIKPFYSNEAGNKLSKLLREHITVSADVVLAAKKDNKKALDAANEIWYANADEISKFLSEANPYWSYDELRQMMHNHLKLTTDEAVARIKKDYKKDKKTYDEVHEQILMMADMLSEGIIKQFPNKFMKEI